MLPVRSHTQPQTAKSELADRVFRSRTYKNMLSNFGFKKKVYFIQNRSESVGLLFVPQFTKINSQASKSRHPQGKQVCCLALRKLISLRTSKHTHTHTFLYKAPEIHSCQEANLNSEPIVFLQLTERNKNYCYYCKHSHKISFCAFLAELPAWCSTWGPNTINTPF